MPRQLLVTSALPYVNGHIHIGHLVEYLQTDMWVRFQRLRGHRVAYLCADDTHGTATMIRARQEGRSEAAIIADMAAAHLADFTGFGIAFSHYGSTDSASNRRLVGEVWAALRAGGHVVQREVTQLFDPKAGTFLADRFVKGTCPRCKSPGQYGDSCDKCSSTYSPTELIDPVSTLSGAKPELRSAMHWFVRLEPFHALLERWTQEPGRVHPDIAKWLKNTFLVDALRDWDVSRPAPYFGFEIPDAPGQYFYVWVDAPVGYLASLTDWCAGDAAASGGEARRWWPRRGEPGYDDPAVEIHHFIGKDITYFHTLFWPAMLETAGYKLPTTVHVHGFLTVDGEKMAKSKGTFVRARTYLDSGLDPAFLRYYYASKLGPAADDLDLNLKEFEDKVNADLVGKVVNLASRTARFVERLADPYPDDGGLFARGAAASATIAEAYDAGDFNRAMRETMALADRANEYVEAAAPWALKKDPAKRADLVRTCTVALNLFRQLAVYLAPVLPKLAEDAGKLLGAPIARWEDAQAAITGNAIAPFTHLLQRVDPAKVAAMIAASRAEAAPAETPAPTGSAAPASTAAEPAFATAAAVAKAVATKAASAPAPAADEAIAPTIAFEDFAKLDLRVAEVLAAEEVPGAKKILRLTLSLGGDARRTVFAGIKTAYPQPAALVGRLIVIVANLAPRTMSFGVSEGMAIAAGPGGQDIFLLSPDSGAKPGQRVH